MIYYQKSTPRMETSSLNAQSFLPFLDLTSFLYFWKFICSSVTLLDTWQKEELRFRIALEEMGGGIQAEQLFSLQVFLLNSPSWSSSLLLRRTSETTRGTLWTFFFSSSRTEVLDEASKTWELTQVGLGWAGVKKKCCLCRMELSSWWDCTSFPSKEPPVYFKGQETGQTKFFWKSEGTCIFLRVSQAWDWRKSLVQSNFSGDYNIDVKKSAQLAGTWTKFFGEEPGAGDKYLSQRNCRQDKVWSEGINCWLHSSPMLGWKSGNTWTLSNAWWLHLYM